jgi:hypothetical protein
MASNRKAASLMDLSLSDFLRAVEAGHLPRGRETAPGLVRWSVDDLTRIANGDAFDGLGDVRW